MNTDGLLENKIKTLEDENSKLQEEAKRLRNAAVIAVASVAGNIEQQEADAAFVASLEKEREPTGFENFVASGLLTKGGKPRSKKDTENTLCFIINDDATINQKEKATKAIADCAKDVYAIEAKEVVYHFSDAPLSQFDGYFVFTDYVEQSDLAFYFKAHKTVVNELPIERIEGSINTARISDHKTEPSFISDTRKKIEQLKLSKDIHVYTLDRACELARNRIDNPGFVSDTFKMRFNAGNLSTIVARSSGGKSISLNAICFEAIKQKKKVVYLTLEEPAEQVYAHIMLRYYFEQMRLAKPNYTVRDLEADDALRGVQIDAAIAMLARRGLMRLLGQWANLETIRETENVLQDGINFISEAEKAGLLFLMDFEQMGDIVKSLQTLTKRGDLVLVDYLQRVEPTETLKNINMDIEKTSKEITAIAKQLGVAMVAGVQSNRGSVYSNKSKTISRNKIDETHLRGSDRIFQDSDTVIALGREYISDKQKNKSDPDVQDFINKYGKRGRFNYTVLKNRQGVRTNTEIELDFALGYSYFAPMLDDDGNLKEFEAFCACDLAK